MSGKLSLFHQQFILSKEPTRISSEWTSRSNKAWHLSTHPSLTVRNILGAEDYHIGWILGDQIGPGGNLLDEHTPCRLDASGVWWKIENTLYRFSGRFAVILTGLKQPRVYVDPVASLGVVYSAGQQVVASTTTLIEWLESGDDSVLEPGSAHSRGKTLLEANRFYPAGLTSNQSIRRLLPNHYLDLENWRTVRHWPIKEIYPRTSDHTNGSVNTIAQELESSISGATRRQRSYLTLTGGRDTRTLLACARPALKNIELVTFDLKNSIEEVMDINVVRKLNQTFQLNHRFLVVDFQNTRRNQEYLARIGHDGSKGKSQTFYQTCLEYLDMNSVWITGFGGEIARGLNWPEINYKGPADRTAKSLIPYLVGGTNEMNTPANLQAIEEWLSQVPEVNTSMLHDLMYLELRVGGWASPHLYGVAPFEVIYLPFCNRRIIETMFSLPLDYRLKQQLSDDIIRSKWPELLAIPYNQFTYPGGFWDKAAHAIRKAKKRLTRPAESR